MTYPIRDKIQTFFTQGHERTLLIKKNIAISFGIKGITILISLIMVPLTINYVNSERNGIWLTLYSMVVWLNLFDIGFGNGMKNKIAEAEAKGEIELIKKYISSTYAIIGLICIVIFALFCLINPYLDWIKILGSDKALIPYRDEIIGLVWIFIVSFCVSFTLNLIKFIVTADQRPAIGSFLDMVGQICTLIGVFILSKTTAPSLIYLGCVSGFAPVVVYLFASIFLFNTRYKKWRPSFKYINFQLAGNMLTLGIKFFIASCAAFMITQTIPFLIQYFTNSVEVTCFNTASRLFFLAFNFFAIIIVPYWTSFTNAYTQQDFAWMRKTMVQLYKIFGVLLIIQALLLFLAPFIYYIWVNYWIRDTRNILNIPFSMSLAVCLHTCSLLWTHISIYPLNGIGKIKLQVYSSIIEMILFIPVAWFLGKQWGAPGIVLTPCIIYIPRMIWGPIQLHKLIHHKNVTGIWNQ